MTLACFFLIVFSILAISPHDRSDWMLENLLAVIFIFTLAISYRKFPLSKVSYGLIFIFLILHEIGAHYTYSKVPYQIFFQDNFGIDVNGMLGWERNNFDRVIHFLFGFLLAYPIREFYYRIANTKGFWGYLFPLELVMAASMMFELFEWAAAAYFGGELGVAYLGTQGDVWDAHKDMLLASIGGAIAMLIILLINWKWQRDFHYEWDKSLKIKEKEPLGENKLSEMLKDSH